MTNKKRKKETHGIYKTNKHRHIKHDDYIQIFL